MLNRRSFRLAPWLLVLAAAVGLGLCCGRPEPEPSLSGEQGVSAGSEASSAAQNSLEVMPQLDEGEAIDAVDLKAAAEPLPIDEDAEEGKEAALHPVARFMRNSDQHDRQLLANVERETQKSPSPEVMELLAQRRAGASREQLERFIDTELGSDLRVRLAAKRWLRDSMGDLAPKPSPRPGETDGPRQVQSPKPY